LTLTLMPAARTAKLALSAHNYLQWITTAQVRPIQWRASLNALFDADGSGAPRSGFDP